MLIDINTAAITHRNGTLSGITERNYSKVLRHLYCYNAALPVEYQIHIDTAEYNEKAKANMVAQCGFCTSVQTVKVRGVEKEQELPTETELDKIDFIKILLSGKERFFRNSEYDEIWVCPKCHRDNRRADTVFIQSVIKQPYYLRCVPEPPIKNAGIMDRTTFDTEFESWASTFLEELEQAAAKFRQEYKPKDQSEIDETSIDLSVEDDSD